MSGGTTISAPQIAGLKIQTSTYGLPIPIVWGQQRLAGNLLWYGDFTAVPHSTTSGGKGGGGVTQVSYSYQAAGLVGICEGPITNIGTVWAGKDVTSIAALGLSVNLGVYPQSVWSHLTTNHPTEAIGYSGIAGVYSTAYKLTDSAQVPNHSFEIMGPFQFGHTGQVGKTFSATVDSATISSTAHGFIQNQAVRLTTTGALPQYTVKSPTSTLGYATPLQRISVNFAGLYTLLLAGKDYFIVNPATNSFQLSLSPNGSPLVLHTIGTGTHTAKPWVQGANPKDVIIDFLTNPIYGVNSGFPIDGTLTNFSNYCVASGLFISPALSSQIQASEFIATVTDACNSAPVWSEGILKVIPYGDTPITGNGVTFTPNTTPQYSLTDDDFLSDGAEDPITVTRGMPADAYNHVSVQFRDRANQYNISSVDAKDQSNIDLFGLRSMQPVQLEYVADLTTARAIAQLMLQKALYNRNKYSFKLSWKYARLEPMDLVTITDSALGLTSTVVRVITIDEDEDNQLSITAEEYLADNASAVAYPPQTATGLLPNFNVDSGLSFSAIVIDAPGELTDLGYELWLASAGGINWAGAQVWISHDNTTYKNVGNITADAKYGVLSAVYPVGAAIDTVNTCSVNLTESLGTLIGGSSLDADNHNTLALVGGEIISFSTATLTAANQYNLTTYVRRGIFNTDIVSHAIGESFLRLDDAIFRYAYDPSLVGTTAYVKLVPLNQYKATQYSLADIVAMPIVIQGALGFPSSISGFKVQQTGDVVAFSWDPVAPTTHVDIGYAPQGTTDWSLFTMLTEASRGTEMTNAAVPPGTWTFGIRAHDKSGKFSKSITTLDFTVTSTSLNIINAVEEVGWNGTLVGLVEHYTGVLVPDSQHLANFYTGWEVFDQWVPDPVTYIEYTTLILDALYDDLLRVYSTRNLVLGVGQTGTPTMQPAIRTWLTSGIEPTTFTLWDIGTILMRFVRGRISANITQGGLFYIQDYTLVVDMSPKIEVPPSDISITAPNSTVTTFPTPFHRVPFVQSMIKSGTGKSVTTTSVTTTGCIFKIWDGSTEVSGTLTYTATGE